MWKTEISTRALCRRSLAWMGCMSGWLSRPMNASFRRIGRRGVCRGRAFFLFRKTRHLRLESGTCRGLSSNRNCLNGNRAEVCLPVGEAVEEVDSSPARARSRVVVAAESRRRTLRLPVRHTLADRAVAAAVARSDSPLAKVSVHLVWLEPAHARSISK